MYPPGGKRLRVRRFACAKVNILPGKNARVSKVQVRADVHLLFKDQGAFSPRRLLNILATVIVCGVFFFFNTE